jgi:hypothetical protein
MMGTLTGMSDLLSEYRETGKEQVTGKSIQVGRNGVLNSNCAERHW